MPFRKITVKSGNEESTLEVTEEEYRNYFSLTFYLPSPGYTNIILLLTIDICSANMKACTCIKSADKDKMAERGSRMWMKQARKSLMRRWH